MLEIPKLCSIFDYTSIQGHSTQMLVKIHNTHQPHPPHPRARPPPACPPPPPTVPCPRSPPGCAHGRAGGVQAVGGDGGAARRAAGHRVRGARLLRLVCGGIGWVGGQAGGCRLRVIQSARGFLDGGSHTHTHAMRAALRRATPTRCWSSCGGGWAPSAPRCSSTCARGGGCLGW